MQRFLLGPPYVVGGRFFSFWSVPTRPKNSRSGLEDGSLAANCFFEETFFEERAGSNVERQKGRRYADKEGRYGCSFFGGGERLATDM